MKDTLKDVEIQNNVLCIKENSNINDTYILWITERERKENGGRVNICRYNGLQHS